MGVPKFFRYISERYPCLSELVKEYQIPEFDNLYLDMNGIIHMCSHPDDNDPHFRITEEKIFKDIFHYIEVLFRMIKPKKLFFMAVDGVAPRAKMNQQRGRRFRSAKDAEHAETVARERGEKLPGESRFDSNCITPGTVFMVRLHEQLKYFVTEKISNDRLWQSCKIVLSGHETPGEGEHKIMDYIRYMKSQPGYDPNTRHCLYGLDADLIMLGLCTHEPHFSLLREEVRFGKKAKRQNVPELISFYLLHLSLMREYLELEFLPLKDSLPFEYDMEKIIDDWVLMGFLVGNDFIPHLPNLHITNGALPILYNAYMKILPTLDGYVNEAGQLNLARFEKFMKALSEIDITNFTEHYAVLKYFQTKTGRKLNEQERTSYRPKDLEVWNPDDASLSNPPQENSLRNKDLAALIQSTDDMFNTPPNEDLEKLIQATDDLLLDVVNVETTKPESEKNTEVCEDKSEIDENCEKDKDDGAINETKLLEPSISNLNDLAIEFDAEEEEDLSLCFSDTDTEDDDLMNAEFLQHKNDYYMNKLDYSKVTPEVLRSQAEGYVRAIQWNLHYYYNGVCSWSWFYPHHYAPYISDIKDFADLKLEYEIGTPFKPFEQLLAVLPAASKVLLPEVYQDLMTSEDSLIIDYYPQDFKTDLNGKKQEWEAVVLIPFIDENLLLKAMDPCNKKLNEDEQKRNSHGPMLMYQYCPEDLGKYDAPEYFSVVPINHAKLTPLTIEEIRVPIEKLIKGRYPGSVSNVYYPGFPTFKHLKYKSHFEKAKVRVFDSPSQNDNMIITIDPPVLTTVSDTLPMAMKLLGKKVYVSWPHLRVGMVIAVSDQNVKYLVLNEPGCYSTQINKGNLIDVWIMQRETIKNHYKERLGIHVGVSPILVHVKTLIGNKYVFTQVGNISIQEEWSKVELCFPFQSVVTDIVIHDSQFKMFKTLQDLFPLNSKCFMIGHPHYGSIGEVIDNTSLKSGRIKVSMTVQSEPDISSIIQQEKNVKYVPATNAAQRLAISPHLLSRITGSIFIFCGDKKSAKANSRVKKTNIGLNLKLNKQNEEIPGYTKKVDGQWLYSPKSVELVVDYMKNFPEVFKYIQSNLASYEFYEADLFPNEADKGKLREVTNWIKNHPFSSVGRQKVGTKTVSTQTVQKVIEVIDHFYANLLTLKQVIMQVKPHLLYKPDIQSEFLPPDHTTTYNLYDRVVNVRDSFTVPFGAKGTVVGIESNGDDDINMMFDIIFDKEFPGGINLHCDSPRGYRVPKHALINLSHGLRIVQQKTVNPATNNPWYGKVPSNKPNVPAPNMQSQNSAFVSWNSPGGSNYPPQRPIFPPHIPQQQPLFYMAPSLMHTPPRAPMLPMRPLMQPQANTINNNFQAFFKEIENHSMSQQRVRHIPPNNQQNSPKAILSNPSTSQNTPTNRMPFTSPRKGEGTPEVCNGTEMLRKLLKVSESPKSPSAPPLNQSSPQNNHVNSQQISVQDFFAQARTKEQNNVQPLSPNKPYFSVMLLNYCQSQGIGIPRYNYFTTAENRFQAHLTLADGRMVIGTECPSKEEAAESAASIIMNEVNKTQSAGPVPNQKLPFMMPNANFGPRRFPSPPKQWCQNQPRQQHRSPKPNFIPNPNVSNSVKPLVFNNKSINKEENNKFKVSPFVPLQAVKQQRNKSNNVPHSPMKTNKNNPSVSSSVTSPGKNKSVVVDKKNPQNSSESNKKPKQKKSRIAANFSGVPHN